MLPLQLGLGRCLLTEGAASHKTALVAGAKVGVLGLIGALIWATVSNLVSPWTLSRYSRVLHGLGRYLDHTTSLMVVLL